jgi:mono/diheme cytochrome c family protein
MFPEHLPGGGRAGTGYDAFGMIAEPGMDRPIGFSKRRVLGLDLVGMNCAICHAGSLRATPESQRRVVLGMPSNTVDLQAYFRFLFACALDERFTVDAVMERIRAQGGLDAYERFAYPRAIRLFREKLLAQKQKVSYWDDPKFPRFGAGRIDTFNSVKVLGFDWGPGDFVGTNDFPSVWNQRPRREWFMHWDGNNKKMEERNISAAIGVGVQAPNSAHPDVRSTLDEPSMHRVAEWALDLQPPKFPESRIDRSKLPRGAALFKDRCAKCHAPDGAEIGRVVPVDDPELRTDRERLDSFTPELSDAMNTIGIGYPWRFQNFRKTDGYANQPLDGIWLRAPYLHNGSVPTLRDLLNAPDQRPRKFRRGNDVYDWANVGFDSTTPSEGGREYFEFDTGLRGNGNGGHTYGTGLSPDDKAALLEYLKTL